MTSSDIKYAKRVHAFTDQGVAMLSSVLRSERAIEVNIAIMRAFVQLCEMLASNVELARKLKQMEKVYENGLAHRLRKAGLTVEQQYQLQVLDEDGTVLADYLADLFVGNCLIVELKACRALRMMNE